MTVKEDQNEQESEIVQLFEPSPDLNERKLNGTEPPVVCSHETPIKSENGLDKDVINKEDVQFNDMDRGWSWVVLFASFGSFMLIGSCMNGVGIIHATLLELHGESVGLTSWAGALHTGLASLGAPISSAVLDRYSCRAALVLAGVCYVTGFLATAFSPSIYCTIFTLGILGGLGGGFGYTAATVVVSYNFRARRNIAVGIAMSGVSVGLCVFAPVMQLARDTYGNRGFFIILAAIECNLITFGMLCFPSKQEIHSHVSRKLANVARNYDKNRLRILNSLKPYFKVLCNKGICCLCACMFLYGLGVCMIFQHLPNYIVFKGYTSQQSSYLLSISGVLGIFGRIGTGFIANMNKMDDIIPFTSTIGIVGIITIVYPFLAPFYYGHVIFVVVFGFFVGNCYVVTSSITLQFVDINNMATAIGMQFLFFGIGAVLGPILAGVVVDAGGSYDLSVLSAGICIILATVVGVMSTCFKNRTKRIMDIEVIPPKEELNDMNSGCDTHG